MTAVRVTRPVLKSEPHNFLGRKAQPGEIFHTFHGATYGCVDGRSGIALSEVDGEYPFFEFPLDAIEEVAS